MSGMDKRVEPRRQASGAVRVRLTDPHTVEIEGRLVDISPSGFRMAHDFKSLAAGQIVEFSHVEDKGRARVVWNRILEQAVETGFFVVKA